MDFSYINLLYKELNSKKVAISQYSDNVSGQAGDIYDSVYEAVSLIKEKYKSSVPSKTVAKRLPPTSEFAVEDLSSSKKSPTSEKEIEKTDMKGLDDDISANFSEISFRFQKEQKILQNLVAACQEYQDIVNQIFAAWEQILEKSS